MLNEFKGRQTDAFRKHIRGSHRFPETERNVKAFIDLAASEVRSMTFAKTGRIATAKNQPATLGCRAQPKVMLYTSHVRAHR